MSGSADGMVAAWEAAAGADGVLDVCEPPMLYALEVLGTTVFGKDIHDAEAIVRRSVPVLNAHVTRTALSPVRLASWLPTPSHRRVSRARREVYVVVRDQALVFLLAGHETTGATLAFALHLLGRHPDVQARVYHAPCHAERCSSATLRT